MSLDSRSKRSFRYRKDARVSVRLYRPSWFLVDNGSNDGTQDIIKNFLKARC